jgi:hypothetical protein
MAIGFVEASGWWWVFYAAAGFHLWTLAVNALNAGDDEPAVRRWRLLVGWYVHPVAALTLVHVTWVGVADCGPQWHALVRAAQPAGSPVRARPGEIPPPPGGPPRAGVLARASLDLLARLVRAGMVFLLRVWMGTPVWLFLVAAAVAWVRRPEGSA